jgi:acetyl-CoA synthetase
MARLSDKCANFLTDQGIGKGDLVMLVLKRGYQFWYTMLALHKMGAVAVPVTHLLTAGDYVHRLNISGTKAVIATAYGEVREHVDAAAPTAPGLKLKFVVDADQLAHSGQSGAEELRDWIDYDAGVEAASAQWVRPAHVNTKEDMLLMSFSSGTTGLPKMVWHNHAYPLAHIMTGVFWHRVVDNGLHFTISDTGWLKSLWGKFYGQWLGGSAVFTYDFDKFHALDILSKLEQYQVTTFCCPPTMYRFMIQEDVSQFHFPALTHCTTAGEALNPEVSLKWKELTGLELYEGFGQSETTLQCATLYPWMEPRVGSMGLPTPGYRLRILNVRGEVCQADEVGEICILTDAPGGGAPLGLFGGYYKDASRTETAWANGIYHTGDTAHQDADGYFWYVGRTDDMIKSSGYRIGPFEVENALMGHPAVVEVAVTGVPDPVRGMKVKATIILSSGYTPSPELTRELQNFAKQTTAPYKYPRVIEYVTELPKTISGKIKRIDIRQADQAKYGNTEA